MADLSMTGRVRKRFAAIVTAISLAACGTGPEPNASPRAASGEDIWLMSGTKDAIIGLQQALSEACHVTLEDPEDYQKVPAEDVACVRSRVVSAFDAQQGAISCGSDGGLRQFVSCILEGQFVGRVIGNSGAQPLPAEIQWGRRDERGRQTATVLADRVKSACATPDQQAMKRCVEETMLRYYEIEPKAVEFCPSGKQRDLCMYWAGFAHSIRARLDRINI